MGLGSVPVRHGMTIGEIARLVQGGLPWGSERFVRPLDCELEVVPMRGWRRKDAFEATGLPWVMPSPNMPTVDTAFVYPGLCLIEGTNVSEGRGNTRPFEVIGAPFIDGYRLAERLHGYDLPGVRFRPLSFRPTFHKHAGQILRRHPVTRGGPHHVPAVPHRRGHPARAVGAGRRGRLPGERSPTSSCPSGWPSTS